MKRVGLFRLTLTVLVTLTLLALSAVSVFASSPTIRNTEYEGAGRVEVNFSGDVSYKGVRVKVVEPSGRTYKAKIVEKDSDELTFKLKKHKAGKKYKFKITGIKVQGSSEYGHVCGSVKVPAKSKISKSKAINIAAKHAKNKLHAKNVKNKKADKDTYKGKPTWEVEFDAKINGVSYEFEYNVSRSTGKILRYKREKKD